MKRGLSEICYGFFSTLANPTRLAILETLRQHPMNVTKIAEALDQEQSMVSHNLRTLEKCNLVSGERRGKEKIYSINPETVEGIFKVVENHAAKHCPYQRACSESK
ncbi:MAG: metalloregulator ArsR/SmtB family transcription factor [Candidatus Bathyarchaeota archaeon]|nr:metalloregulator ArsR/SmtB family transcription factor [Candidatus Bathyarchaeota archaeon]